MTLERAGKCIKCEKTSYYTDEEIRKSKNGKVKCKYCGELTVDVSKPFGEDVAETI